MLKIYRNFLAGNHEFEVEDQEMSEDEEFGIIETEKKETTTEDGIITDREPLVDDKQFDPNVLFEIL
eukprot:CAMPEP_0202965398 /NCGR_PEP_ID=MMETSP1396-20130829/9384_1 /ASSEMBLY_ACC=CAM_ASM_000872 /TAXON_ID= /ORGANISM="Pseudokeronopsis sp., Strain Brazil" /LENGTH=66 /DNA_ID=CAMNT_0049688095 /DNA_START=1054 /DNA_END=1254 /DNA_ORIENTATION=-